MTLRWAPRPDLQLHPRALAGLDHHLPLELLPVRHPDRHRIGAGRHPGDAEVARAQTELFRAEQLERVSRARLADVLGIAGTPVEIDAGGLLQLPPPADLTAQAVSAHPVAVAEQARVSEARAQEQILERSYFPKFNLQSTVFGRGSGANPDGTVPGGVNGLGLARANWA